MWKIFLIAPKKAKIYYFIGLIFAFIWAGIVMMLPVLLSQFLSLIIQSENNAQLSIKLFADWTIFQSNNFKDAIVFLIGITFALIVVGFISAFLSLLIVTWAGEMISANLRNILFAKYQKLSIKDISNLGVENLITRINDDVGVFWDFLMQSSNAFVRAPFFIAFGVVFALFTDLELSVSIFIILPFLFFTLTFVYLKTKSLIVKNKKNLESMTKNANDSVSGIRFIKSYNLQNYQFSKFKNSTKKWTSTEIKTQKYLNITTPVFFALINLISVIVYVFASKQLKLNPSDLNLIPKINVFIEYVILISFGVMICSQFLGVFFKAKVASKRIIEIIDMPYENLNVKNGIDLTDKNKYSITFKDLNYKYHIGLNNALNDLNFSLPGGKVLGIIGPTGSGKSTIANLLIYNMKYSDGHIYIDDNEITKINTKSLHEKVGIVYQDSILYSGSLKDNMLFAVENATDQEIDFALENACAKDFVYKLENNLNYEIEEGAVNLSGGQKQRISIARALLKNPKILILDDSLSALDNITTQKIISNIKNNYNSTMVIISQKINAIKHADLILVLDNGKITEQGSHLELLSKSKLYKEVYENQMEE
ncbi:ABC transporter ATP-binding protein [Mycoplasmopsis synoviae]|uniref:ABC transporter ATP-binding protein n=1 Tax=Mycoplasmopsis synoviae TaxID=2109 RepID=UPI001CE21717|nr:ABC transporter ATP-binding protein [Mycoplasmopsis synoviae]UBX99154.1 ABC transporter ATP-binding protein/permease [Mycoplasmopsis synoviae]UBY00095.1 ABC transporter ATP-binding protein/permease [Mycoplasmopsis synoviae]